VNPGVFGQAEVQTLRYNELEKSDQRGGLERALMWAIRGGGSKKGSCAAGAFVTHWLLRGGALWGERVLYVYCREG